jgi:hypothetical protein
MIKLINILSEIQIKNPNRVFKVTDKGRITLKEMSMLFKLLDKYGNDAISDQFHDEDKYLRPLMFVIAVDESIIKPNEINEVDNVIDGFINRLGNAEDEDEAMKMLKEFEKDGYITPIRS